MKRREKSIILAVTLLLLAAAGWEREKRKRDSYKAVGNG